MATATLDGTRTAPKVDTRTASEFLTIVAAQSRPEYAPGRVNGGRQASFDAVAAWNSVGRVD